ncbi:hypothetical protein Mapa_004840 [Marchantia paleacea]|nr:hypothetical protein Mapa_004840 [Marchantia paleacea]
MNQQLVLTEKGRNAKHDADGVVDSEGVATSPVHGAVAVVAHSASHRFAWCLGPALVGRRGWKLSSILPVAFSDDSIFQTSTHCITAICISAVNIYLCFSLHSCFLFCVFCGACTVMNLCAWPGFIPHGRLDRRLTRQSSSACYNI